MMNRFFTLLFAASCLTAVGQCEVDYDCEADYDFGEAVFGISPNPQEGQAFEYGEIDEGYYDVLHILIPSFSDGIDSNLPVLPIDSLVVMESTSDDSVGYQGIWFTDTLTQENFSAGELGLEVLFNNNGVSSSNNSLLSGQQYCAAIFGTPIRSGTYRLHVSYLVWATLFGVPFSLPYTLDGPSLFVGCGFGGDIEITDLNSLTGSEGIIQVFPSSYSSNTEITWLNAQGSVVGEGLILTVDQVGVYSALITADDCVSGVFGLTITDESFTCSVEVTPEIDEGEIELFDVSLQVMGAQGQWSATWYDGFGLIVASGPSATLSAGQYEVLVVDEAGCSEVSEFECVSTIEECSGENFCGEGTAWDPISQKCIVANPSDSNFDGCVQLNDLLDLLSAYGDCGAEESAWQCGDPLEYQGYDYETVQIGEQCWFAENLRSENYENGDAIPSNLSDNEWQNTASGAVAVYGEDAGCINNSPDIDACDPAQSLNEYGRLYNWYAVDDARGLCPSGWHIPADVEWTVLKDVLGGGSLAGGQMKTTYGWYNGGNGTNSSGFSGLPGGFRSSTTNFFESGKYGEWWSSTPRDGTASYTHYMQHYLEGFFRGWWSQSSAHSVRCIKD